MVFSNKIQGIFTFIRILSVGLVDVKGLSTLGSKEPVSEYQHKMVLCSHLEYPIWYLSLLKAFRYTSLAASTKQWTAPE